MVLGKRQNTTASVVLVLLTEFIRDSSNIFWTEASYGGFIVFTKESYSLQLFIYMFK